MSRSVEFWSSVELGAFARGLLRELRAVGWNATQRSEVAENDYRAARSLPARSRLRWRSYVSYVLSLRRRFREEQLPDAVIVCTNTFYAPAVALRAAHRFGIPVVHWVFDLFPEVLVEGGTIVGGGSIERTLGRFTRSTFQRSAANVFLGQRLLEYARKRYGEIRRGVVIPVGADGEAFRSASPQPRSAGESVRALYCGNLGRMHDTNTLIDVLRSGPAAGWRMEFRGHGAGFRMLADTMSSRGLGNGIILGDSLAESDWTRAMKAADVALVTMKRGAEGLVMPSKAYSAMVAGQAILAICPSNSDLADTVRRHDAGWVVEPGDAAGLTAVLSSAAAQPGEVLAKRRNAFRAGHDHYDQKVLAARWVDLLTSIGIG